MHFVELGWSRYFGRKTLTKLNIVIEWCLTHGRANEDDEQDDQDPLIPDDHIENITSQRLVSMMLKCFHKFRVVFKNCINH